MSRSIFTGTNTYNGTRPDSRSNPTGNDHIRVDASNPDAKYPLELLGNGGSDVLVSQGIANVVIWADSRNLRGGGKGADVLVVSDSMGKIQMLGDNDATRFMVGNSIHATINDGISDDVIQVSKMRGEVTLDLGGGNNNIHVKDAPRLIVSPQPSNGLQKTPPSSSSWWNPWSSSTPTPPAVATNDFTLENIKILNIKGGKANDVFRLVGDSVGDINGGAGTNIVTIDGFKRDYDITLITTRPTPENRSGISFRLRNRNRPYDTPMMIQNVDAITFERETNPQERIVWAVSHGDTFTNYKPNAELVNRLLYETPPARVPLPKDQPFDYRIDMHTGNIQQLPRVNEAQGSYR